jgi:O-antigen/teichoic acid export membrane protein
MEIAFVVLLYLTGWLTVCIIYFNDVTMGDVRRKTDRYKAMVKESLRYDAIFFLSLIIGKLL